MRNHNNAFAVATVLAVAAVSPVDASETKVSADARHGFAALSVIGAAYHDPRVATTGAEVHRQGGFAVAGATLWPAVTSDAEAIGGTFDVPAVVGAAYHSPGVALNAAEVRRQGGLATAGAVNWRPAAGTATEVKVEAAALGTR